MAPQLSVVIPTFNRASVLERCLAALRSQSAAATDYEVIVVDDGSMDDTRRVVERATAAAPLVVRYAHQANAGPAAARNRGVALAAGEAVLFLGDDAIADRHLIRAHLAAHDRAGLWGGGATTPDGPVGPWAVVGLIVPEHAARLSPFEQFLEESGLQFNYSPIRRDPHDVPFAMFYTANASAPRAALVSVGGFDERFRDACWEDVELGYRLARAGVRFRYVPAARVDHAHPVTLQQYLRRMDKAGRAARRLVALHPQDEVASLVAPLLMSRLGYRVGRVRSLMAQALVGAAETSGMAQRYPRLLRGWYSVALHYAFNRSFYGTTPGREGASL